MDTDELQRVLESMPFAAARRLHAGRTVIVVQTELTDDDGKPAAQVTQAQAVIAPR
jgi:acyl-coenzyme A thioesterase PaaI-like protein